MEFVALSNKPPRRSGLMRLLMGSSAETLMRQSHLPLLVIRSTHSEEGGEGE